MTARGIMAGVPADGAFGAAARSFSWSEHLAYLDLVELARRNHPQALVRRQRCIVEAGQFGDETACGLINPGVLQRDGSFQLLCRGELDDSTWLGDWWKNQATPVWCVLDEDFTVRRHCFLRYPALPRRFRPEDWRLFEYRGALLTNHSIYLEHGGRLQCRPGISTIDLERRELTLRHLLVPPFQPSPEEKNWALFAHEGALLCVYSFNPYTVLEIDFSTGTAEVVVQARPARYEWLGAGGRFIGNSTNPIRWDEDHYIMFVHDYLDPDWPEQRNRLYMQYAVLISASSLLPTSIVPTPLLIGGLERGRYAGVHYTTSLVSRGNALYAFYGEGDSHSGVVELDRAVLADLLVSHRL
jgi:hypothetical protein